MMYIARWKVVLVVVISLLGVVFAAPTALKRETLDALPGWLPHKQVNLGLDLQGGSYLLLEVKVEEAIRERLDAVVDSVRTVLRNARIGYTGLGRIQNGVAVTIRAEGEADVTRARQLLRESEQSLTVESDGPRITIRMSETLLRELRRTAVEQSLEVVRRRIDESGLREPDIQAQGADRILVQLPGVGDPQQIKRLLGQTAKMTFHLLDESVNQQDIMSGRAPPGTDYLPADNERQPDGKPMIYPVRSRVIVSGESLVDAQPTIERGRPVVTFRFDSIGARKFADVTRRNVGKPFAIVLDKKVITAPSIREPILGGSGIISGNFTTESARELALLLRTGALPVPLTVLEERTVGPGLGSDSVEAGTAACLVGYALIVILMVAGYGLFGIIANIALLLNLAFTIAIMTMIGATLTLPGIAGMVLGLAMAVDANVLIYERMREEQDAGRTPFSTVETAFQRAIGTIIDSNLTTLIAALLLYLFGSGPVRGFAVTLSIGIICSMFTAVTVTRVMVVSWLVWRRPKTLPI